MQPEAVPAADVPVPADLIIAARLSLAEVTSTISPCSAYYIAITLVGDGSCVCGLHIA